MMIILLYAIHTDAFKIIYIPDKHFTNMFLILLPIRVFPEIYLQHHGDCRILANGMQIWHLECCYHLTPILGRRSRPDTLGIASECVYTTFFWTPTSHTLHQLSEDVLLDVLSLH